MPNHEKIVFCKGGGCTAKLGAGALSSVLSKLPRGTADPNLLVGYDSKDDAAVYKISDDAAFVQTLDFFPPMIDDPYTFGQIAAANALSDIYAMGGSVKTALNIVCFPEDWDLNILGEIMQGGAAKVMEAGGVLAGGHSIADADVKYGLSVTGLVNPKRILQNNTGKAGDVLILTKPLGVGIICCANRIGAAHPEHMEAAIKAMTTLNRYAAEAIARFNTEEESSVHACTDVTGFGLLGHLSEMTDGHLSAVIDKKAVPVLDGALEYAADFLLTAAAQRNRNFVGSKVCFDHVPFPMEEVLFDPQTSGGLLVAVAADAAARLLAELWTAGVPAKQIGELVVKNKYEIYVR